VEGKLMAEKDGLRRLSAPAAAAEGDQDEQPKKSRQTMSENKPDIGQGKSDRNREGTMQPARPSDLYNAPRGMLDRSLQAQLGRQLRAIFSDVAQEPVPDRFVKLLEALEAREKLR
jgi:hypothetical protein